MKNLRKEHLKQSWNHKNNFWTMEKHHFFLDYVVGTIISLLKATQVLLPRACEYVTLCDKIDFDYIKDIAVGRLPLIHWVSPLESQESLKERGKRSSIRTERQRETG